MDWTTIIVALIASSPGLWALRHQRLQTEATVVDALTDSALDIVKASREEVAELRREFAEYKSAAEERIKKLEEEVKLQEIQIDNNNSFTLKLQLIITILTYQLRERGIRPYVEPSEMESITLTELRDRAATLSNIVSRLETGKDTLILK